MTTKKFRAATEPHRKIVAYLRSREDSQFQAITDDIRHDCGLSAAKMSMLIVDLADWGIVTISPERWWTLTEYGWSTRLEELE